MASPTIWSTASGGSRTPSAPATATISRMMFFAISIDSPAARISPSGRRARAGTAAGVRRGGHYKGPPPHHMVSVDYPGNLLLVVHAVLQGDDGSTFLEKRAQPSRCPFRLQGLETEENAVCRAAVFWA